MPKSTRRGSSRRFRARERQPERSLDIILAIFLGVAVLMLVITVALTVSSVRRLAQEIRVPGYVIDLVVRRDQAGNAFYYPVVAFSLPDGSRQTVQLTAGSWPPAYAVDEAVTVAYDPQHPLKARITSAGAAWFPWIAPLITGTLGVAFLGAALGVWWFLMPHATERPEE